MPGQRRQSQAVRLDRFARIQLYLTYPLALMAVGSVLGVELGQATLVVVAFGAVHCLVDVLLLRAGLDHYLNGGPRPTLLVAVDAALTVLGAMAGYLCYPHLTPGRQDGPATFILIGLVALFLTGLSIVVRLRTIALVVALGGVAAFGLTVLQGIPKIGFGAVFTMLYTCLGVATCYRGTAWTLDLVWQLDRSRHAQASLAVAQERLRFARDLHDVVGRTLSVVALKAELAAQLSKRGRPEAGAEMLEVRRIAQESLAELRALVGGYRSADLATELAGARSLLACAGIECQISGDSSVLPARVQAVLGWVVREGTTNVLRHSEARSCSIAVRLSAGDTALLVIDNDVATGVDGTGPAPVTFGSGLLGIRERLGTVGGTVEADRPEPGRFRLTVQVPVTAQDELRPVTAAVGKAEASKRAASNREVRV